MRKENILNKNKKNKNIEYDKKINQTSRIVYNNKTKNINDIELLYKKIFYYNKEKKKSLNYIDNKLNLFYCENEEQYNEKMNKRNNLLLKGGKPIKHLICHDNGTLTKDELLKKYIL